MSWLAALLSFLKAIPALLGFAEKVIDESKERDARDREKWARERMDAKKSAARAAVDDAVGRRVRGSKDGDGSRGDSEKSR